MGISEDDLREIKRYKLKPGHISHTGVQRYSTSAVHDENGSFLTNEYFYRAMSMEELDSYRDQFAFVQVKGHQGWAPFRDYSVDYLDMKSDPPIRCLVEAHVPGFVKRMNEEGWVSGKAESGCVSWGIGTTQSNGWAGSKKLKVKSRKLALHPWDIFHEKLKKVRIVDLLVQI